MMDVAILAGKVAEKNVKLSDLTNKYNKLVDKFNDKLNELDELDDKLNSKTSIISRLNSKITGLESSSRSFNNLVRSAYNISAAGEANLRASSQNNPELQGLAKKIFAIQSEIESLYNELTSTNSSTDLAAIYEKTDDIMSRTRALIKESNEMLPRSSKLVTVDYDEASKEAIELQSLRDYHDKAKEHIALITGKFKDLYDDHKSLKAQVKKWSPERSDSHVNKQRLNDHPYSTVINVMSGYYTNVYHKILMDYVDNVDSLSRQDSILIKGVISEFSESALKHLSANHDKVIDFARNFSETEVNDYLKQFTSDKEKSPELTADKLNELLFYRLRNNPPNLMSFENIVKNIVSRAKTHEEAYETLLDTQTAIKKISSYVWSIKNRADYSDTFSFVFEAEDTISDYMTKMVAEGGLSEDQIINIHKNSISAIIDVDALRKPHDNLNIGNEELLSAIDNIPEDLVCNLPIDIPTNVQDVDLIMPDELEISELEDARSFTP